VKRNIKPFTIVKHLIALKQCLDYEWVKKDWNEVTKKDLEKAVKQMMDKKWTAQTQKSFKCALKVFWKFLKGTDGVREYPNEVKWINTTIRKEIYLRPEHIFTREEIEKMSMVADTFEKAVLWTAFCTASRPSEFFNLKKSSLKFTSYGVDIFLFGRLDKPQRSVPCIECTEPLRAWLRVHPLKDKDDFLWVARYKEKWGKMSGHAINDIIKKLATKAGVEKKHMTLYTIRKSRLTEMAGDPISSHVLNDFAGWSKGSDISKHYIAISQGTIRKTILHSYGLDDETNEGKKYIECAFCGKKSPASELNCSNPDCGKPLVIIGGELEIAKNLNKMVNEKIINVFKQLGLEVEQSDDGKNYQVSRKNGKLYMEME
jgi:site-specific recombinase XerD